MQAALCTATPSARLRRCKTVSLNQNQTSGAASGAIAAEQASSRQMGAAWLTGSQAVSNLAELRGRAPEESHTLALEGEICARAT